MKKLVLALGLLLPQMLSATSFEPMLIGGQPAKPGEYPEIVYISSGNARCSATVVGPQAILTAGHCVTNGSEIKQVEFVVGQIVFHAVCEQSPGYHASGNGDDMALCKTDKPITVKYASISKAGPKVGDQVVLAGYGCIDQGGGRGNDGILRIGAAPVTKLPSADFTWFVAKGKSALCFGDSGGPSFLKGSHSVIGVNSQGNIKDTSYLSALWIDAAQAFFKDFAAKNSIDICGVTKGCGKTDDSAPSKKCAKLKKKADIAQSKYDQCQKTSSMDFEDLNILED